MKINNPISGEENTAQINYIPQREPYYVLRKFLKIIYSIGFIVAVLLAFGSLFVFDGSDYIGIRYGVFVSAILLPIFIFISIKLSKKSILWFLLPILPLITFVIFNNFLDGYISSSNKEFCRQAIMNNDRSILDNPTLDCYKEVNS